MELSVEKASLCDFLIGSGGLTNKVPRKVAVQSCLPLFTRQLVDDSELSEESQHALERELDLFIKNLAKRWIASNRSRERLAKTAAAFLDSPLKVTVTPSRMSNLDFSFITQVCSGHKDIGIRIQKVIGHFCQRLIMQDRHALYVSRW